MLSLQVSINPFSLEEEKGKEQNEVWVCSNKDDKMLMPGPVSSL